MTNHTHHHLQVKTILDEVLEKLPEEYNMSDITSKTAERTPYILVCFQECERMNALICEIRRSLRELDLGLKVCFILDCACFQCNLRDLEIVKLVILVIGLNFNVPMLHDATFSMAKIDFHSDVTEKCFRKG